MIVMKERELSVVRIKFHGNKGKSLHHFMTSQQESVTSNRSRIILQEALVIGCRCAASNNNQMSKMSVERGQGSKDYNQKVLFIVYSCFVMIKYLLFINFIIKNQYMLEVLYLIAFILLFTFAFKLFFLSSSPSEKDNPSKMQSNTQQQSIKKSTQIQQSVKNDSSFQQNTEVKQDMQINSPKYGNGIDFQELSISKIQINEKDINQNEEKDQENEEKDERNSKQNDQNDEISISKEKERHEYPVAIEQKSIINELREQKSENHNQQQQPSVSEHVHIHQQSQKLNNQYNSRIESVQNNKIVEPSFDQISKSKDQNDQQAEIERKNNEKSLQNMQNERSKQESVQKNAQNQSSSDCFHKKSVQRKQQQLFLQMIEDCTSNLNAQSINQDQTSKKLFQSESVQISQIVQSKLKVKVGAVKNHYKHIINTLQLKLQELSAKHNEPIEQIDVNQSVIFSQEESFSLGNNQGQLELKICQIQHLKEQLQLQESLLTNVLEEELKLKQKLEHLQTENNQLASMILQSQLSNFSNLSSPKAISHSHIINHSTDPIPQENYAESEHSQHLSQEKEEREENQKSELIKFGDWFGSASSMACEEQTNQLTKSLIRNTNLKKSAILVMSILQGVGHYGLLASCRFMNEINKRFILSEIKKHLKIKIDQTILLSPEQEQQKINISLYSIIKGNQNVLILLKMANQQAIALFIPSVPSENQQLFYSGSISQKILLINLNPRKSYSFHGTCKYTNNELIFGKSVICMSDIFPFTVKSNCSWWQQKGTCLLCEQFEVYHISLQN